MLGNRTLSVFSEFLLRLQSSDPRDLIHLSRIRAEAIATSVSRVLTEREQLLCGWTVFSPSELNLKFSDKFEEKVLLLVSFSLSDPVNGTEVSSDSYCDIHCCKHPHFSAHQIGSYCEQSYDYTLEKVKQYTRVPLGDIIQITKGNLVLISRQCALSMPQVHTSYLLSKRRAKILSRMQGLPSRGVQLDKPLE